MAHYMQLLITTPALAVSLARNGRYTALRYSLGAMADALEDALARTHDFFVRRCPLPPVLVPAPRASAPGEAPVHAPPPDEVSRGMAIKC